MMRGDEQSLPHHIFSISIHPCRPLRHEERTYSSVRQKTRSGAGRTLRESSSRSSAVKALDVAGRQQSPSAAEADVCVLCLDPMDGQKKSLFELGFRHQYYGVCVYNLLKDGEYRSCPLCQTKIPAELQERAMTFVQQDPNVSHS